MQNEIAKYVFESKVFLHRSEVKEMLNEIAGGVLRLGDTKISMGVKCPPIEERTAGYEND